MPGHGAVASRAEMVKFRDSTATLHSRVHQMIGQKKSKDDVAAVLRKDFGFEDLHINMSLDGLMAEMR